MLCLCWREALLQGCTSARQTQSFRGGGRRVSDSCGKIMRSASSSQESRAVLPRYFPFPMSSALTSSPLALTRRDEIYAYAGTTIEGHIGWRWPVLRKALSSQATLKASMFRFYSE